VQLANATARAENNFKNKGDGSKEDHYLFRHKRTVCLLSSVTA
jgi:hypothetical protein